MIDRVRVDSVVAPHRDHSHGKTEPDRYAASIPTSPNETDRLSVGFAEAYYDSMSGGKRSMFPLLNETSSIDPVLIVPRTGACPTAFYDRGIPVDVVPYSDRLDRFGGALLDDGYLDSTITALHLARYHRRVFAYLRRKRFDTLYCNNLRALLLYGPPASCLGIPVVWYVRIDSPKPRLDAVGLRLADHVITISEAVRNRFSATQRQRYDAKFETIYTGIDTDRFHPDHDVDRVLADGTGVAPADQDDSLTITEIATIQPRKRQHHLVRAVGSMVEDLPAFTLVFAGDVAPKQDQYASRVVDATADAGIEDDTVFLGWCDDVPALLAETDICVLPSVHEGLPRTVLEAAAMEVPVIATPAGGTEELITDGETGLIVPMDDTDALADAILRLQRNPAMRRRLGRQARAQVVSRFDRSSYVQTFEDYVRTVVSDPGHGSLRLQKCWRRLSESMDSG